MKMTIDELAEKFNKESKNLTDNNLDKRYSKELSTRRIRDYVSKGILEKPIREGRNTFYNEEHLKKLIEIRQAQQEGLTDSLISKIIYYNENENQVSEDLKIQANSAIEKIENKNSNQEKINKQYDFKSLARSTYGATNSSGNEHQISQKQWTEFQLDEKGNIFLKIESNLTLEQKCIDNIQKKINKILKEKKND